ncbi:MAG: hypothetical protein GXY54_01390 [Deltaproteobacteria bacterium]|nr:hypothetical protein [Deltaproteobacteria bacterium]
MKQITIVDILEKFNTQRVIESLAELDIGTLLHNPLVIAAIVAAAALALYLKWRVLFVTILTATALVWLLNFIMERGTDIDTMSNPTLLVFIGIGCGIIGLIIYFMFIRSD